MTTQGLQENLAQQEATTSRNPPDQVPPATAPGETGNEANISIRRKRNRKVTTQSPRFSQKLLSPGRNSSRKETPIDQVLVLETKILPGPRGLLESFHNFFDKPSIWLLLWQRDCWKKHFLNNPDLRKALKIPQRKDLTIKYTETSPPKHYTFERNVVKRAVEKLHILITTVTQA